MITKEEIQNKVSTNPNWAARAIVVLYNRQTEDEKATQTTQHHNGVGFSGFDADILSSFAEQILAGRNLSQKQLAIAYKRLPRYWRQLLDEAQAKEAETPRPCPTTGRMMASRESQIMAELGY